MATPSERSNSVDGATHAAVVMERDLLVEHLRRLILASAPWCDFPETMEPMTYGRIMELRAARDAAYRALLGERA